MNIHTIQKEINTFRLIKSGKKSFVVFPKSEAPKEGDVLLIKPYENNTPYLYDKDLLCKVTYVEHNSECEEIASIKLIDF